MYQKPIVEFYACEEENTILVGSVVIDDKTTVTAAEQEKGVDVDMRGNNFSHEWN